MNGRRLVPVLALMAVVVLTAPSVGGQEPPESVPEPATTSTDVGPVSDLDGDGGSPGVFVALSLLGGATALSIMVVQWLQTRPRPAPRQRQD